MKKDELSILFNDKDEEDDKLEDGWYEEDKIEIVFCSDCCDEMWIGWLISNVKIDEDALELEDDDGGNDNMLNNKIIKKQLTMHRMNQISIFAFKLFVDLENYSVVTYCSYVIPT